MCIVNRKIYTKIDTIISLYDNHIQSKMIKNKQANYNLWDVGTILRGSTQLYCFINMLLQKLFHSLCEESTYFNGGVAVGTVTIEEDFTY